MNSKDVQATVRLYLPLRADSDFTLKSYTSEVNSVKAATHQDVSPALLNIPDGSLSLTVLTHRWAMSYEKTCMVPRDSDPFILHRPGSRQSLLQSFRVSVYIMTLRVFTRTIL